MRPSYEHAYEFFRDTKNLVESCSSLRELYEAMLSVKDANMREVDASPKRLRDLAEGWTQFPAFVPIRLNELFNGLQVEHTDDYVLALVGGLGGRWEEEVRLFMLRHDHELRDEIFWRVFEVEGGGQISLANVDKFSREDLNWHNTVVLLTNEGTLDRTRVLRSCLEALNRDFSAYRAGWFSRVYEALSPTPQEATVNQDLLRLCMGSSVTATLSLGVKQSEALHKAGMLEADEWVQSCGNAFSGPKTAVVSLVRMLDALASKKVVPVDDVANVLILGLSHVHADVQRACIKALKKLEREELAYELRDLVAPAVAAELLPVRTVDGAVTDAVQPSVTDHAPLQAEPLQPWTDEDALERYAALLEAGDDALEFELAMAWIATAANAVPILWPLSKRATALLKRDDEHFPAALLLSTLAPDCEFLPQRFYQHYNYVNGESVADGDPIPQPTVEESIVIPSFATRMREVIAMTQGRIPRRGLLATPTDSHGWIDLPTLKARVKALGGNADLLPADRTQALLRVSPDQRAEALVVLGGEMPTSTSRLRIEWRRNESDTRKPDGSPQWVFWSPLVQTDSGDQASLVNPALIPTESTLEHVGRRHTTDLLTAACALATPDSTDLLTSVGLYLLFTEATMDEVEHRAPMVLKALSRHPGEWTSETMQLLAFGMATKRSDVRALACELFAVAVRSRLDVAAAAQGFADCSPAVVLTRWAEALKDVASLAPAALIDLLTLLLPRLDQKERGVGALMSLLLDESLRHAKAVNDAALREWLGGFKGSSAPAKTAKALLALKSLCA